MEIVKVSSKNFKEVLEIAARAIQEGKVIVCPTDTVYGLLADARDEKAVKKVFRIKKRPEGKPIPIFVKDIKIAKQFAEISDGQEKFLKKIWPGKITIVFKRLQPTQGRELPRSGKLSRPDYPLAKAGLYTLPKILFWNKKTIGLRIPDYRLIDDLLEKLNFPLTGTSANISGISPSTKIKEVIVQFKNQRNQPDLILDRGNLKPFLPSTVIDLTSEPPKILRKGADEMKVKKLIKSRVF